MNISGQPGLDEIEERFVAVLDGEIIATRTAPSRNRPISSVEGTLTLSTTSAPQASPILAPAPAADSTTTW